MITKKTMRNGKVKVSSSYFEGIQMLKDSMKDLYQETYKPKWEVTVRNPRETKLIQETKFQSTIQKLIWAKMGVAEVSAYAEQIPVEKWDNYIFDYGPAKPMEPSYDEIVVRIAELESKTGKTEEEFAELAHMKYLKDDWDAYDRYNENYSKTWLTLKDEVARQEAAGELNEDLRMTLIRMENTSQMDPDYQKKLKPQICDWYEKITGERCPIRTIEADRSELHVIAD